MVEVLQLALDPCVAPARVFFRHPDNQFSDPLHHSGTTHPLAGIRPFRSDEPAVPRENRIGGHDRRDLAQGLSAQRLPFRRQSATLIVGETHASPARLQLFFEDSILFDQVGDLSWTTDESEY
jgi:hypothetical protein